MKSLIAIPILILLVAAGCGSDDVTGPQKAWVATDPIQCLGNPWEQDWLEAHGGDYEAYPRDPSTPGLEPEEEEIITEYYDREHDVKIFDIETAETYEGVCRACSCPQGYTLYLLIPTLDVETMLDLGYTLEGPKR
ncbi:MAG: hypothetical protein JSW58_09440 [Candidatus Latescibacterota bacterium]|nr:MAG: hypothetical protein JSW58_09440 [Candidatus Latescibacterota bacterium]